MSESGCLLGIGGPKPINATVHGCIDYSHAAFFLAMGVICSRKNKPAAAAAFATGGMILAQSLMTDYKLGAEPIIPFRTHGIMDAVMAASSWMMPMLFGFRGTKAAKVFAINSAVEAGVVALTDWSSERARADRMLHVPTRGETAL